MTQKDLAQAKNADLRGSFAAMQRAAEEARRIAIQTDTALVIEREGKVVCVPAEELRKEMEQKQADILGVPTHD